MGFFCASHIKICHDHHPQPSCPFLLHMNTSLLVLTALICREITQQQWPVWRHACPSWPEPFPQPKWTLSAHCPGMWFVTYCIGQHLSAGWFIRLGESIKGRRLGQVRGMQHWSTISWASYSSQASDHCRTWPECYQRFLLVLQRHQQSCIGW